MVCDDTMEIILNNNTHYFYFAIDMYSGFHVQKYVDSVIGGVGRQGWWPFARTSETAGRPEGKGFCQKKYSGVAC